MSDHWGEDMIVSSHALRDMRHASALTYVEVGTLTLTLALALTPNPKPHPSQVGTLTPHLQPHPSQVGTIAREDLEDVLVQFPTSERAIRQAWLGLGLRLALTLTLALSLSLSLALARTLVRTRTRALRQAAMKIAMQRAIVVISEFVRMQQLRSAGAGEKGGLGKLKGAIGVVSTLGKVGGKGATSHLQRDDSRANANDPSVILTMITGGKMKEVDEEGLVVEEEDDEPPHISRRMSSRSNVEQQVSSSSNAEELLLEMKLHAKEMKQAMADSRKEMTEALAEMRKEIVDLKSQVTFSSA